MKKDETWGEINEITDNLESLIDSKHDIILQKYTQFVTKTEKLVESQIDSIVDEKLQEYDNVFKMFSEYKTADQFNIIINGKASLDQIMML